MGLAVVVFVPVLEELVFRVFLQSLLLRVTRRPWVAIVLTSVLFTLVHLGGGVPLESAHALAPLFVLSVAMGVAYERTRSVWAPVVMHAGFNGLNVLIAVLV